mgnify:CR=1 FL=1
MDCHLQDYLRNGGSLTNLEEVLRVKHKRHGTYPNLLLFSYSIGCSFEFPLQLESRGIILDEQDDWRVVSRSFDKFFNLGEGRATAIDWASIVVNEKQDGSLVSVYRHNGNLQFATTGTPDANCPIGDYQVTFAELFRQTLQELSLWPLPEMPGVTLLFELCTPLNRVVVNSLTNKVFFLGAREAETGCWLSNDLPEFSHLPKPRIFSFRTREEVLASLEHFSGLHQEGYVVTDANYNRVKIKHPEYVQLHHSVFGTTYSSIVELALKQESSEILAHFPDLTKLLKDTEQKIISLCVTVENTYAEIKDLTTRREFAQRAKFYKYSAVLFKMLDKKLCALEVLRLERIKTVIEYLKEN